MGFRTLIAATFTQAVQDCGLRRQSTKRQKRPKRRRSVGFFTREQISAIAIFDKEHRSQFRVVFDSQAHRRLRMDTTTLLVIILVLILLFGGGWYGRGRWY